MQDGPLPTTQTGRILLETRQPPPKHTHMCGSSTYWCCEGREVQMVSDLLEVLVHHPVPKHLCCSCKHLRASRCVQHRKRAAVAPGQPQRGWHVGSCCCAGAQVGPHNGSLGSLQRVTNLPRKVAKKKGVEGLRMTIACQRWCSTAQHSIGCKAVIQALFALLPLVLAGVPHNHAVRCLQRQTHHQDRSTTQHLTLPTWFTCMASLSVLSSSTTNGRVVSCPHAAAATVTL